MRFYDGLKNKKCVVTEYNISRSHADAKMTTLTFGDGMFGLVKNTISSLFLDNVRFHWWFCDSEGFMCNIYNDSK